MPVLINDLEVELQSPAAESDTQTSQSVDTSAQSTMSPSDLSIILEQQMERLERVRAH